jgi:alanyl-tRNA synthetase
MNDIDILKAKSEFEKKYGSIEKLIFELVTTYGFPLEHITEKLSEIQMPFDMNKYNILWEEHRKKSKGNKEKTIFKMDNEK